jgi:peptidoglycan/xylan/chitin deacetylase (PgdA/CDA1 family)
MLLREIADRGHEIACHSFWPRLVYDLTPEEFEADALLANDVIEQEAGLAVQGYCAPSFSITESSLWALDVPAGCGFTYDSSIFPIHHDIYGMPAAPAAEAGSVLQFSRQRVLEKERDSLEPWPSSHCRQEVLA